MDHPVQTYMYPYRYIIIVYIYIFIYNINICTQFNTLSFLFLHARPLFSHHLFVASSRFLSIIGSRMTHIFFFSFYNHIATIVHFHTIRKLVFSAIFFFYFGRDTFLLFIPANVGSILSICIWKTVSFPGQCLKRNSMSLFKELVRLSVVTSNNYLNDIPYEQIWNQKK